MSQRLQVLFEKKPCYDIVITKGFEELQTEVLPFVAEKKVCIITDTNVQPLYASAVEEVLKSVCSKVCVYAIMAGEENKTLDNVKDIYAFLIKEGFERKDVLIALGGGVVGDMTGYVAATYLRGVDYIQIPTTLLSQNDSSIGG